MVSSVLHQQNFQYPHSVDSISHQHPWQTLRPSGAPPSSYFGSCRFRSDSENKTGRVSSPLHTRPTLSHTSQSDWRDQPAGPLENWLDQKPVHHCCPVVDGPLSASGQLPSPHRTTTVSSVSVLRRQGNDKTAQHLLLRCQSHKQHAQPPTTP